MADIFETIADKIKYSKFVLIVGFFALMMLVIGINHFIEDYYSSRYGLADIESHFGLIPVVFGWTYFTMSLTPQVAQIVFTYMFLSDTKKYKWALLIAMLAFVVDFFADLWYRSDSNPFESLEKFVVTSILTFSFFTVGSEMFITAGGGLVLELAAPFKLQIDKFIREFNNKPNNRQNKSNYGTINDRSVIVMSKSHDNDKNSHTKATRHDITTLSVSELSKKYKVSKRTAYRWKNSVK